MKFLNKLISFVLCLVLIINSSSVVYGAELIEDSNRVHLYSIPVESNDYLEEDVTFYEFNGKYYLNLEDVKEFTRCSLTEDEETITLTHGLREIVIEKSTGHMTDSGIVDQGNIILLKYDGKYLCEGIPMLIYLGATCTINEHKKLEVLMPAFTIWESIMPDYLEYCFNINELYGGEDNVEKSLILDIIADVFDGVSGHGLMANADTHLEDALYEILNVDMLKYESVKEIASAQNQKINEFLLSAVFSTIMDTGDNMYDAVYEALDYYSRFYISAQNDILLDMMTKTDDLDYASELASQIREQVYAQSAAKANLKNAKKVQSFMDIGMLAFDTAITSFSMMQYSDDTKNLFTRTINQEMFEYADYYDISWNNVSDKISNTLKSTQSIVTNTAIDNVAEFAVEKAVEEGAKKALSKFTSKADIYTVAIQIGFFLASLVNYESNQAFSADMNAIWLSAVQYDVAMLVSSLLVKERDEFQFSSTESLEKLKDMFTLYYRTTIAFSENIAKSIEEFGTKSNQKWVPWFNSTTEASVGNYAATYLYRITNCTVIPVVDYSGLSDELLTAEWISQFEMEENFEEKIIKAMNDAAIFAWGWFWDNEHYDPNDFLTEDGITFYRINESNIRGEKHLEALTKRYFTDDVTKHLMTYKEWIGRNNSLYVSENEGLGGVYLNRISLQIEKESDTKYVLDIIEYGKFADGSSEILRTYTVNYELIDGYWVFDKEFSWPDIIPISVTDESSEPVKSVSVDSAYKTILDNITTIYSYDREYFDTGYIRYFLYDINDDGIKELAIDSGTCEANSEFHFYTIVDSKAQEIGSVNGWHSGFYECTSGGLFRCEFYGDYSEDYAIVYKISMLNNIISEKKQSEITFSNDFAAPGKEIMMHELSDYRQSGCIE